MNNNKISISVFIGFFIGMILISCKEQKATETRSGDELQEISNTNKTESDVTIEAYFPGANFMKFIVLENNPLSLKEDQQKIFTKWREENHSNIEKKMKEVAALEIEMKALSQNKADAEQIMAKLKETARLRKEIATTKLVCRNHVMETLRPGQWDTLVEKYQNEYPFVEREKMMEVVKHVNPAPNYMKAINKDTDALELTTEQKSIFDAWSSEHHPQMMEMANKVISLEKEIYETSLQNDSEEIILEKIDDISKLRNDILAMKTQCRDMVIKYLEPEQWRILVEITK